MQQRSASTITISKVSKRYGDVRALDDVDLEVRSGEFLTLLGPSGSGKTTLLMALAGFTRPDSGSIRIGDHEMILMPPHKRDIGMVFQNYALFPHLTVAGNVGYPLKLRKTPKPEIASRVEEALETVQLGGYGDRRISQLSGGQKQRVALARAIVFNPRILLMDEPLSALDKKLREHMQIELRRLHEKLGMTTVYVTHDQREALTMSDRIAVINHGRLMQLDEPRLIYERPANKFIADFIGESTFLPVERDGDRITYLGNELKVDRVPQTTDGLVMVLRPERLVLLTEDRPDDLNIFEGVVKDLIYQGETSITYISLQDGTVVTLRASTRAGESINQRIAVGDNVHLGLDRTDAVLIPNDDSSG